MIKALRTPDERFENLPDYDFSPNYLDVADGLRLHYLDEGDRNNPIVLLLHGEPSWSFLYRKMIPVLVDNGFRTIAPDLIGFGKSDKPAERSSYTYQSHLDWLTSFIEQLDLKEIFLFCQDWGGLLGLRILTEMDERFSMVVVSNTALPTGNIPMPESFMKWQAYSQHSETFDIGKVIDRGTSRPLSDDVMRGYNAPFPGEKYKAGARMFPMLIPITEEDPESKNNIKAWEKLGQWTKPMLTLFGEKDDIMKGADAIFQGIVPGTKGQDHDILDAGHFIQEEAGEELAKRMIAFYKKNS